MRQVNITNTLTLCCVIIKYYFAFTYKCPLTLAHMASRYSGTVDNQSNNTQTSDNKNVHKSNII